MQHLGEVLVAQGRVARLESFSSFFFKQYISILGLGLKCDDTELTCKCTIHRKSASKQQHIYICSLMRVKQVSHFYCRTFFDWDVLWPGTFCGMGHFLFGTFCGGDGMGVGRFVIGMFYWCIRIPNIICIRSYNDT